MLFQRCSHTNHKSYKLSARFQFESQELTAKYLDILKDVRNIDILSDSSRHIHVFHFRAPELSQRDQMSWLLKRKKTRHVILLLVTHLLFNFCIRQTKSPPGSRSCLVTHKSVCHVGLKVNPEEDYEALYYILHQCQIANLQTLRKHTGVPEIPLLVHKLMWLKLATVKKHTKKVSPALKLTICKLIILLFKALGGCVLMLLRQSSKTMPRFY